MTALSAVAVIPLAQAYALSTVYPNPVHGQAHFTLAVQHDQQVQMELYDELGRRVARLHDGMLSAHRTYRFRFDADGLPAGVYFLVSSSDHFRDTRSMIVIR